jgi:Spy/CpxP family protein refolding chaperone
MTNKQSIWRVLGFSVLLLGSASFIGLALADEKSGSGSGMSHHSGMMGGGGSKGHGKMPGHMSLSPLAMKDELGLKEDQIKAIEPLETDYRKHGIRSRADVRVAMIDLGSLLDQKNPDRSAISAKVDEISGIRKQMMMYRVDTLLKLKEILTPEQYAQFRSKIKAQMERGMGRRMHGMSGMTGHGKMGGYDREKDYD